MFILCYNNLKPNFLVVLINMEIELTYFSNEVSLTRSAKSFPYPKVKCVVVPYTIACGKLCYFLK